MASPTGPPVIAGARYLSHCCTKRIEMPSCRSSIRFASTFGSGANAAIGAEASRVRKLRRSILHLLHDAIDNVRVDRRRQLFYGLVPDSMPVVARKGVCAVFALAAFAPDDRIVLWRDIWEVALGIKITHRHSG